MKKTMLKKVSCVAAMVLCLSLTACGGDSADKKDSQKTADETKTEESKRAAEKVTVKDLSDATEDEAWEYAEEFVEEIRENEPTFGDYEVSIADFGATVKEDTDMPAEEERELAIANTKAIYKAICDVSGQEKGGTVVVPAGVWYTSAIKLESNVNLHLEEGAILRFAESTDLYEGELMKELYGSELAFSRNEGIELYNYYAFLYAYGETNIAVTGKGKIDGQANVAEWGDWRSTGGVLAGYNLLKQGETEVPVEERLYGETDGEPGVAVDGYIRPNFVEFIDCDKVLLEDFTTANSPMWQIHPVYCSNVIIRGLKLNSLLSNNDGIDPDSCKNVLIEENVFNTGDDCIAIKSGKNADGLRVGIASENIMIQNNTMEEGHGGITLGSEASAGIRNVFARNNVMSSPREECALRFKNSTLRGNVLENIYYKDTTITAFKGTRDLIVFESDYGVEKETEYLKSEGLEIVERTPITRNVYIDGVKASQEQGGYLCNVGIYMRGIESSPITNVNFKNIEIERPTTFIDAQYVDGMTIDGGQTVKAKTKDILENCKNITFKNFKLVNCRRAVLEDYNGIENFTNENFTIVKE